jgi:hypothetical protein
MALNWTDQEKQRLVNRSTDFRKLHGYGDQGESPGQREQERQTGVLSVHGVN